jgi:hypothetical protein
MDHAAATCAADANKRLLLIEQNIKRAERTQRNQFKSHQVCLTKRELLKHFVCFIDGVEIQKKDDAFIILPDIPMINFSREIKSRRSGNLTRHDCFALLGGEWCDDSPDREDFCGRDGRERAWWRWCLHAYMLRKPLDQRKRSLCVKEPPLTSVATEHDVIQVFEKRSVL